MCHYTLATEFIICDNTKLSLSEGIIKSSPFAKNTSKKVHYNRPVLVQFESWFSSIACFGQRT